MLYTLFISFFTGKFFTPPSPWDFLSAVVGYFETVASAVVPQFLYIPRHNQLSTRIRPACHYDALCEYRRPPPPWRTYMLPAHSIILSCTFWAAICRYLFLTIVTSCYVCRVPMFPTFPPIITEPHLYDAALSISGGSQGFGKLHNRQSDQVNTRVPPSSVVALQVPHLTTFALKCHHTLKP